MSKVVKIQKVKPSGFGEDIMDWIKDGRLFILMRKMMIEQREWTRTSEWKSTDHSSSNQECQWEELFTPTAATSHCTTWIEEPLLCNSTSMKSQRQSNLTNGSICLCQWVETTSWLNQLTQDGSNFSDGKLHTSSMKEERSWMFQEDKIIMDKTFTCGRSTVD